MGMLLRCAALIGLLAGCYSPTPPAGSPCERTDECPTSQRCSGGHCLPREAPDIDAAIPDDAPAPPIDAAIDAAPLACSALGLTCANTATTFPCGGDCWVRCNDRVPRETARLRCVAWQGALGQIDDAAEQTCVAKLGNESWLGLLQRPTATVAALDWTWNGATALVYTHWQNGAPDDGDGRENGAEQCAKIQGDGTWDDVTCTVNDAFLCERP